MEETFMQGWICVRSMYLDQAIHVNFKLLLFFIAPGEVADRAGDNCDLMPFRGQNPRQFMVSGPARLIYRGKRLMN